MSGGRRRAVTLALALAALIGLGSGCASSRGASRYASAARLGEGAVALARGDFGAARQRLIETREACGNALLGRQALLLLGALELDPRNPDRDPRRSAELTARYLRLPETFPWTRPLAGSLYLLAREMGGKEPSAESLLAPEIRVSERVETTCEEADRETVQAAAGELPALARPSVPSRLRELETAIRAAPGTGPSPG